ncbi:hypothetical protein [Mycolicibacterium sp.]|uniref:hypothetical protein n=1 Tax=Mycolicibacterium sp. TaxID=2320850 RepID=UPI0028A87BF5|nr:hypothetical protein [Mycolicibacterium sp.]
MPEPTLDPDETIRDYPRTSGEPVVTSRSSGPGWMAPVALALSVLAAAAAGWSLFKPTPVPEAPEAPGTFSANAAAADPKAAACKTVALVAEGVSLQSRIDLGPEPVALETVAANTRLSMVGGSVYLRENTPSNTPAELAEPIGALANQLQEAAQYFFVGQTSSVPEQAERLKAAATTSEKLAGLCK